MAAIPVPGSELRHVRKTITFTGGAGAGAVGTVTVFPITGRVFAKGLTAFCTTSLTDAGGVTPATITLGVPSKPTWFSTALDPADGLLADQWWDWGFWGPTPAGQAGVNLNLGQSNGTFLSISEDVIITIANEAVTGGVIVFDIWYTPVTDDGALAGDDIDSPLVDAVWDEPQSGHVTAGTFGRYLDSQLATIAGYIDTEIGAIKAVTDNLPNSGALSAIQSDLDDLQTRLPAALVGGRMDSSVGAMAAAVITAAAVATDAIDADALAADAVTEIWAKAMSELASVPAVNGTVLQALEWIFLLARNKLTQTATTQTLRNDADNANLSTSTVSDDGTTFTRGEWS